jgi:antitoxin (DNA-binding transcriptional repressor) of toxin-antitoxin stability system
METIARHKAKTTLSQLVKRAREGEVIYIGGFGKPEVTLSAVVLKPDRTKAFGCMKGEITMAADFDTLPASVTESFYGSL